MTTASAILALLFGLLGLEAPELKLDLPACVMVGRGYKCAPVKVEVRLMTRDTRAGWWDRHVDASAELVLTFQETTRMEAE